MHSSWFSSCIKPTSSKSSRGVTTETGPLRDTITISMATEVPYFLSFTLQICDFETGPEGLNLGG